jgi:HTH-type transcriptional regulator, sugar sensing transcriptional regulator
MDESIFQDLGLTNAETKVYLALLEIGETTAGKILDKTSLQNSTVHKVLNKLVQKGYVSFIIKSKTRHYKAVDPESLLQFIDEKRNKLKAAIPILKSLQKPVEKQEAEIYEGFKGLKNMLQEFVKDAKKGDEYLFFSFYTKNPEDFEYIYRFYAEFDKEREKRGIVTKGIVPKKIQHSIKDRMHPKIKVVDFPIPTNISVFQNKVLFTPWEDKKISFLIHSRQLADSFRIYFYSIWDTCKH